MSGSARVLLHPPPVTDQIWRGRDDIAHRSPGRPGCQFSPEGEIRRFLKKTTVFPLRHLNHPIITGIFCGLNGGFHALNGLSRTKNGLPRTKKGLSRRKKGLSRAKKGLSRAMKGLSRPMKGLSRGKKGLSRGKKGLPRGKNGLSRGLNEDSRTMNRGVCSIEAVRRYGVVVVMEHDDEWVVHRTAKSAPSLTVGLLPRLLTRINLRDARRNRTP